MRGRIATAIGWIVSVFFVLMLKEAEAQVYHFQHYDIFSGLGQSQVSDIEQDRFGYIWLSTRGGGLSRFDGTHFTTYRKEDNLPANNILSLEIDPKGTMYIGTPFGLSIYDGKSTRPVKSPGREPYTVSSVIGDQHRQVYAICNASQLGKLVNDSLVYLKKNGAERPSFFSDMSGTPDKRLMVSTFSGEIFEVTSQGLQLRYQVPGDLIVKSILFDSKDSLWLGTEQGVFRVSTQNKSVKTNDLRLISKEWVYEITEAGDGSIWMGLAKGGMRYREGCLLVFNAKNGFTDFMVKGMLEDREGNMWFTTDGDGVYKFTSPAFTSLNSSSGLSGNTISCFALTPSGKLWLSYFEEGLDVWDTKTQQSLPVPPKLRNRRANCLAIDNEGNVWVGLAGAGVYKVSKNNITYIPLDAYISQGVTLFMEPGKGKEMWISTSNGVLLHDGRQIIRYSTADGLKGRFVRRTLKMTSGELLVSGPRGLNLIRNGEVMDFVYDTDLASFAALSMAQRSDGLLALGSFEDGIALLDPETHKKSYFTVKNGLCSNLIYNVVFDRKGRLWVGTERGIDRLTIDKNLKITSLRHFNETDGFTARETNANTAFISPGGDFWVGTIKGLFRYHENAEKAHPEALKVHITDVKLPFDTTDLAKYAKGTQQSYHVPTDLELPHTKNQLKINFIAINHTRPDHILYQYRLEGADDGWLGPTDQTGVVYSHLTPGLYQFKVRASLGDNHWGSVSAYTFKIIPPFYQRWWFILLLVAAMISFGILAQKLYIQYRTRRVLAYEKLKQEAEAAVRVQIAQDFHDELGNRLAAIRMQSNVLKLRYNGHETEEKRIVGEIEKNVVRLFRDTKDFIWSIDPESNRINELALYIKDLGENLLQDTPIRFHTDIHLPAEFEEAHLPPGWSIQVIMIFKEALTNCVKHAHCQNIYFSATVEHQKVSFELYDDGTGIKFPTEGYHKGLNNMRLRAERIHCQLIITPEPNKGTRVALKGSIPTKTASPENS